MMRAESYRRYALAVLMLAYMLSYLDRGLILLLLQPIKEDLLLSDTQLGFLTGIAFGLFYATLGVPIARWADRGNRVTLAAIAIALWSATVMSCLFVRNFAQLVVARVAAAVGEAGCMPPTYSLLGDLFPRAAERTRAMAVYWLASPVALLVSLIIGGWLNERYGWRMTFFLMGLPALAIAAIVRMTLVEPRLGAGADRGVLEAAPSILKVCADLWGRASTRHLTVAIVLFFTLGSGLAPWYAAFMMRNHGMGTAELGLWLGAIFGVGGIVGILAGGYLSVRWFSGDERGQMRLSAGMVAALVPCFALFLLLPGKEEALVALVPLILVGNFVLGPVFALLQRLVPEETRATTLAVVMLLANLIGMGAGPQLVGMLSDALTPVLGKDALRYAMLTASLVALGSAWHFWRTAETLESAKSTET